jgi:hypothetical protein
MTTTPPTGPDHAVEALDQWLADHHRTTLAHAQDLLDIEVGLREILIARHHTSVHTATEALLDIDAGLHAITGQPSPSAPVPREVPPDTGAAPAVAGLHPALYALATQPAPERLRLGANGLVRDLQCALSLNRVLSLGDLLARSLVATLKILAGAAHPSKDHARDLNRDLDLDRARALALDLARDLVLDRALALDLVLDRALALDLDLDRARALARALALALDLARALARALALDLDLDRALDRVRALDLAPALDLALDLARDLTEIPRSLHAGQALSGAAGEILWLVLTLEVGTAGVVTAQAEGLLRDLRGADLSFAEASGLRREDLVGVRWSVTTRWPLAWADWAQANSVRLGSDEWVIRPGTAASSGDMVPAGLPAS